MSQNGVSSHIFSPTLFYITYVRFWPPYRKQNNILPNHCPINHLLSFLVRKRELVRMVDTMVAISYLQNCGDGCHKFACRPYLVDGWSVSGNEKHRKLHSFSTVSLCVSSQWVLVTALEFVHLCKLVLKSLSQLAFVGVWNVFWKCNLHISMCVALFVVRFPLQ